MEPTARFEVLIGQGDFARSLREHLQNHPGHVFVTAGFVQSSDEKPDTLIGITERREERPFPE